MPTHFRRVLNALLQQPAQVVFIDPGIPGSDDRRKAAGRRARRALTEQGVDGFAPQSHGALACCVARLELFGTEMRMKLAKPRVDRREPVLTPVHGQLETFIQKLVVGGPAVEESSDPGHDGHRPVLGTVQSGTNGA